MPHKLRIALAAIILALAGVAADKSVPAHTAIEYALMAVDTIEGPNLDPSGD